MFEQIKSFIRKVGIKMGIIEQLESIGELNEVKLSEGMHQYVYKWRALHKGKLKNIHNINYMTISGMHNRDLASLQMPKVLVQEMAKLIFNERCNITISETDKEESEFADKMLKVLDDNSFYSVFQEKLEYMFAQGGLAIKPYVENGQIKLGYATADSFYPTQWDDTGVKGGLFVSELSKNGKNYIHLEYQQFKQDGNFYIEHKVYVKENDKIKGAVSVDKVFPNVAPVTRVKTDIPLFVYIKPNVANNIDITSPLGISIYANSLDTIKSLDIAFDSFQNEYILGRKRMLVGMSAIKASNPIAGQPELFVDPTERFYEALNGGLGNEPFKEINSTLRIQEHVDGINSNLAILALQTGFDPGSFSFERSGLKTATEVVSENSRTFKTKQSHENRIERGIIDLIRCMAEVGKLYGVITSVPENYEVSVFFDDSIANDRMADITEQAALVTNKFQSRLRAIQKLWGYTEEEALALMKEIDDEDASGMKELDEIAKENNLFGENE